jgi:two-component system chemotaxis response regulator CheY
MRTAMIVDDIFFMRNLLRSILELEGYTVVNEAGNGEEAVAKYRTRRPDLVMMDVLMPVKSGIDATREIIGFDRSASVVMCSAIGQEQLIKAAREAGAIGVVFKPFKTEDVQEVLREVSVRKSTFTKEGNRSP